MAFGFSVPTMAAPGDNSGLALSPDMLAAIRQQLTPAQPAPAAAPAQSSASVSLPMISADVPKPQAGAGQASTAAPAVSGGMTDQQALMASADRLGLSPVEWGGIIHYESGGDPSRWGGTGGRHVGLIQFGPNEQKQFGVTGKESFQEQLGKAEAFLASRGYKPGMGVMNAYSTINAGSPGRFNASDANNGGMPGTVADKVNGQFAPHYAWANKFLGGGMQLPAPAGGSSRPAAFGLSGPTQKPGSGSAMPFGGADTGTPDASTAGALGLGGASMAGAPGSDQGQAQAGGQGKGGQKQNDGGSSMQFRPVRPRPFGFMAPMQFAGQNPRQPRQ